MGSAAADDDALDGGIAQGARLAFAPVDLKMVLIVPSPAVGTSIGCVAQRRALAGQGSAQHAADGVIQALSLLVAQCVRPAQGMKSGGEERFVRVDVAQTRQEPLVE